MKRFLASALLSVSSLLVSACSSMPLQAKTTLGPRYVWKGFEIIGNHKVASTDIQAFIPVRIGDTYQEDFVDWRKWCADIKSKFAFAFTECSAVRYANFDAYFVVEIVEPGFEYRIRFRGFPTRDIAFATQEILNLYEQLYKRLWELFGKGTPPLETSDKGYLDYSDPEMHGLVQRLVQLVPPYRANLLDVLENDKDVSKREKAANLLNWTVNDLDKSVLQANRLLDDPSSLVRNNISRFTMHFLEKVHDPSARQPLIDQLLLQLDRPSHGDRNKAVYNLLIIAQKFPDDRSYIKTKGLSLIRYISGASILSNVKDPALQLLKLLSPIHHYVFFGRDRERSSEERFLGTPAFEGAQLMYAWKELESNEDNYDFSKIQKDLDFLNSKHKKLFVQLQDTTFDPSTVAVPDYLRSNPKYHGGVVYQYNDKGQRDGMALMRWDPSVRGRLHQLLRALGKAFDGKIEGITLQESAITVEREGTLPEGFSYVGYRDAIRSNMQALKEAFPKSVCMQYANFMPGEWLPDEDKGYLRSIFDFGKRNGVAIGAPDLMPKKKSQQNHAYKFMNELGDSMLIGIAVQEGNYSGTTNEIIFPTEPWPNIVPDLDAYARAFLKVRYIFWGAQEPYFSHDVVPYFK